MQTLRNAMQETDMERPEQAAWVYEHAIILDTHERVIDTRRVGELIKKIEEDVHLNGGLFNWNELKKELGIE